MIIMEVAQLYVYCAEQCLSMLSNRLGPTALLLSAESHFDYCEYDVIAIANHLRKPQKSVGAVDDDNDDGSSEDGDDDTGEGNEEREEVVYFLHQFLLLFVMSHCCCCCCCCSWRRHSDGYRGNHESLSESSETVAQAS